MPVDSHSDSETGSRESRGSIDQREHVLQTRGARGVLSGVRHGFADRPHDRELEKPLCLFGIRQQLA